MDSDSAERGGNLIFAANDGKMHGIGKRISGDWRWVAWFYQDDSLETWRIRFINGAWSTWQNLGKKPALFAGIVRFLSGEHIAVVGENQPAGGSAALLSTAIEQLPIT